VKSKIPQKSFNNIRNCFQDDLRHHQQVEVGTLVEVSNRGEPLFGVVRWIGHLPPPDHAPKMAGIEMVRLQCDQVFWLNMRPKLKNILAFFSKWSLMQST